MTAILFFAAGASYLLAWVREARQGRGDPTRLVLLAVGSIALLTASSLAFV